MCTVCWFSWAGEIPTLGVAVHRQMAQHVAFHSHQVSDSAPLKLFVGAFCIQREESFARLYDVQTLTTRNGTPSNGGRRYTITCL